MSSPSVEADPRRVRDLAALALVLLGCVGLLVAAWCTDWRVGLAVTSAEVAALGVFLGAET